MENNYDKILKEEMLLLEEELTKKGVSATLEVFKENENGYVKSIKEVNNVYDSLLSEGYKAYYMTHQKKPKDIYFIPNLDITYENSIINRNHFSTTCNLRDGFLSFSNRLRTKDEYTIYKVERQNVTFTFYKDGERIVKDINYPSSFESYFSSITKRLTSINIKNIRDNSGNIKYVCIYFNSHKRRVNKKHRPTINNSYEIKIDPNNTQIIVSRISRSGKKEEMYNKLAEELRLQNFKTPLTFENILGICYWADTEILQYSFLTGLSFRLPSIDDIEEVFNNIKNIPTANLKVIKDVKNEIPVRCIRENLDYVTDVFYEDDKKEMTKPYIKECN